MILDLFFYWKLLLRRLPVMMLLALVCSGLGVITAMKLPETWSTSAKLLLEAPQIPENMVNSTVKTDATEQLDIIQQKLLTRANLIDIAHRFRVFRDIGNMNPDTVLAQMRQSVRIKRSAGRNRATLMTISFEGRSGRVVSNVVNEMVTLVLAENTSFRVSRAENTLDFFRQEVARLSQQLDEQSVGIAQFRSENADALPEDQRYRLDRLNLLQERMAQLQRDKVFAETQRAEVVQVFENTGQFRDQNAPRQRSPQEEQLIIAKAQLDQALGTYSERHPRVVQLQRQVDKLEAEVAAQIGAAPNPSEETDPDAEKSAQEILFRTTLADADTRIASLGTEIEQVQQDLDALQQANSRSAANGITLAGLQRDYENIQQRYNAALNNLNEAQMSERIESTAQGQRITVVENANIPQTPSGPNRTMVAATGAAFGMMLAAAYFMLLELINRTIRHPDEFKHKFNITPITTIPFMEDPATRWRRRRMRIVTSVLVLIFVPLGLWYVDTNHVPLDVVVQKGLQRLGLG